MRTCSARPCTRVRILPFHPSMSFKDVLGYTPEGVPIPLSEYSVSARTSHHLHDGRVLPATCLHDKSWACSDFPPSTTSRGGVRRSSYFIIITHFIYSAKLDFFYFRDNIYNRRPDFNWQYKRVHVWSTFQFNLLSGNKWHSRVSVNLFSTTS